jgi:hypothetical protein
MAAAAAERATLLGKGMTWKRRRHLAASFFGKR